MALRNSEHTKLQKEAKQGIQTRMKRPRNMKWQLFQLMDRMHAALKVAYLCQSKLYCIFNLTYLSNLGFRNICRRMIQIKRNISYFQTQHNLEIMSFTTQSQCILHNVTHWSLFLRQRINASFSACLQISRLTHNFENVHDNDSHVMQLFQIWLRPY